MEADDLAGTRGMDGSERKEGLRCRYTGPSKKKRCSPVGRSKVKEAREAVTVTVAVGLFWGGARSGRVAGNFPVKSHPRWH